MGTYLDHYPDCKGCPHVKYCGLMVGSIKLCNSYDDNHNEEIEDEESEMGTEEYFDYHDCWDAIGGDWEG